MTAVQEHVGTLSGTSSGVIVPNIIGQDGNMVAEAICSLQKRVDLVHYSHLIRTHELCLHLSGVQTTRKASSDLLFEVTLHTSSLTTCHCDTSFLLYDLSDVPVYLQHNFFSFCFHFSPFPIVSSLSSLCLYCIYV